jgi:hypothetical protein
MMKIASANGWTIESGGRHKKWFGPDGHLKTVTSNSPNGTNLMNIRARLRLAGLPIDEPQRRQPRKESAVSELPKFEPIPPVAEPCPTPDELVARSLETLEAMLFELSEQFSHFRRATQESLAEIRGKAAAAERARESRMDAPGALAQMNEAWERRAAGIEAKIAAVAASANPIAAYRKSLGG